jgi:hypothetical protein
MTVVQECYNRIVLWIDTSERNFDLRGGGLLIELFDKTFPEAKALKQNLIDLLNDKQQELFKPTKNDNH